jgi:hypothetical protein
MTTYKYTDATNLVVHIIDDDGISRSSCLASSLPEGIQIISADPQPNPRIAQIYEELTVIDQKSIRALRDSSLKNDKSRLQILESQAETLRVELASLGG